MSDMRKTVFEALDNAVENDTDFSQFGGSVKALAEDLVMCCAEVEDEHPDDLIPHVQAWLDQHDVLSDTTR